MKEKELEGKKIYSFNIHANSTTKEDSENSYRNCYNFLANLIGGNFRRCKLLIEFIDANVVFNLVMLQTKERQETF